MLRHLKFIRSTLCWWVCVWVEACIPSSVHLQVCLLLDSRLSWLPLCTCIVSSSSRDAWRASIVSSPMALSFLGFPHSISGWSAAHSFLDCNLRLAELWVCLFNFSWVCCYGCGFSPSKSNPTPQHWRWGCWFSKPVLPWYSHQPKCERGTGGGGEGGHSSRHEGPSRSSFSRILLAAFHIWMLLNFLFTSLLKFQKSWNCCFLQFPPVSHLIFLEWELANHSTLQ